MPKYFYEKSTISTYEYTISYSYVWSSAIDMGLKPSSKSGYGSYVFSSQTGVFTFYEYQTISQGTVYVSNGNPRDIRMCILGNDGHEYNAITNLIENKGTGYNKGTYIETVQAEDGVYPNNGVSGDYWYTKTLVAETAIITAQNGGETVDKIYNITWTASTIGMTFDIELSKNNGQTWKSIATNITGLSYSYDYTLETESSLCLLRIRPKLGAYNGVYDSSNSVFTIQHNTAPTSPTNLTPSSTVVDRTKVQRLSWIHNDTDSQSKFNLMWSSNGGTSWNTITQNTTSTYVDISANTFPVGSILWKVQTYDSYGLISPYSSQSTFTSALASSAAIITSSASIAISRPVFQWSQSDQIAYQIQVLNSLNAVVWDSLEVNSINKAVTCAIDLINTSTYTFKIKTKNNVGIWTEYSTQAITVSFTAPAIPVLSVQVDIIKGNIKVLINNPTPTGTQPTVLFNDLYKLINGIWVRIATNIPNNSYYKDYVASGTEQYKVKVTGTNNTVIESLIINASLNLNNIILNNVVDNTYIDIKYDVNKKNTNRQEVSYSQFAGRKKPVTEFGEHTGNEISLSFTLLDIVEVDYLESMIYSKKILLYRDKHSRKMFCTTNGYDIGDMDDDTFAVNLNLTETDYSEEVV